MASLKLSAAISAVFWAALSSADITGPWSYVQNYTVPPVSIKLDASQKFQTMYGGGCSGAFGWACQQLNSTALPQATQDTITETLFSENIGGLSILRNEIGAEQPNTILGSCPSSPSGPYNYTSWTNLTTADQCQVALSRRALQYNPNLFIYADAWSAPGCYKTTGTQLDGGFICGVRGASNCTADYRAAYADYLLQYVDMYAQQGINISMLGAYNEPDFNPYTYDSGLSDGYQAKDFLEILYPAVKARYPHLLVSCCDATGYRQEQDLLYELNDAGGQDLFDVATWHNYQSNPEGALPTNGKPNIQTEWADGSGPWNTTWDITGQLAEGFQWALYMHNAFTTANTSGYTHWWCAGSSGGDQVLIHTNGSDYEISSRLWAFAGFFRFARPGSVRIAVESSSPLVYVSAFQNTNGTVALPVINSAHSEYNLSIDLGGLGCGLSKVDSYLSDNEHNVTLVESFALANGTLTASVEPRAMKTFFLH